jgi:hypothetical protein
MKMSLIQLIYISSATRHFSQTELRTMLKSARPRNERRGVSGVLLYKSGSFLQVIEGEAPAVDELFGKIATDPRHKDVLLLSRREMKERNFPTWNMGFVAVDAIASQALPGFSDFFRVGESFLDLKGDTALVHRILEGFRQGRWHQHVETV